MFSILIVNSSIFVFFNFLSDCDDDGESGAGARLLHLLDILGVKNVCVVVSRWYGGVHLGPDRFRHINNAARQLLAQVHTATRTATHTATRTATHRATHTASQPATHIATHTEGLTVSGT